MLFQWSVVIYLPYYFEYKTQQKSAESLDPIYQCTAWENELAGYL